LLVVSTQIKTHKNDREVSEAYSVWTWQIF